LSEFYSDEDDSKFSDFEKDLKWYIFNLIKIANSWSILFINLILLIKIYNSKITFYKK
jgi:hypothetical protein